MNAPATSVDALPVAVIGAGPVGLAAAAQLARRDQAFVLLESGLIPGAAVAEWGHVRSLPKPCHHCWPHGSGNSAADTTSSKSCCW